MVVTICLGLLNPIKVVWRVYVGAVRLRNASGDTGSQGCSGLPVLNLLMSSVHLMASYKTSGLKHSNIDSVYGNLVLRYHCF